MTRHASHSQMGSPQGSNIDTSTFSHVDHDYNFDFNPWQDLPHSDDSHHRMSPSSDSETVYHTSGIERVYHSLINGMYVIILYCSHF
jgi:hypothetical protein